MISPPSQTVLSVLDLRREGLSRRAVAAFVAEGRLIRVRRGAYLPIGSPTEVVSAAELGGRLDCVSLLRMLDVFVRERHGLHVQCENRASRLPTAPGRVTRHWRASRAPAGQATADLVEALAQSCRCQEPRDAIATLDSAWHLGLVGETEIAEVLALLPLRFQALRPLLDGRSESGPESLVRLMLRGLGCRFEVQVPIRGVGRVDFVVDGWLIVECDSEAHHSDWQTHKRDRRRDLEATAQGFTTIRLLAEDVLYRPETVVTALRRALSAGDPRPSAHVRVRNS